MSKFIIFLLGAILGLIIGGLGIFYFFGGAPRAAEMPGALIKPPDAAGSPAGTAQVALNQDFFNSVLTTIFRDMNAPAFPLSLTGQAPAPGSGCEGNIVLLPEGSGAQTGVVFENNQILAPLAFRGSTQILGQCLQFTGWAQANLELRYDETQQTVFGQINVQTVNLDGVNPLVSGFVTPIVQTTLNNRVNPITILRGQQIALNLPIAASNGNLQARIRDVRAEVKDNALNLFITYNFGGAKNVQ